MPWYRLEEDHLVYRVQAHNPTQAKGKLYAWLDEPHVWEGFPVVERPDLIVRCYPGTRGDLKWEAE